MVSLYSWESEPRKRPAPGRRRRYQRIEDRFDLVDDCWADYTPGKPPRNTWEASGPAEVYPQPASCKDHLLPDNLHIQDKPFPQGTDNIRS